MALEETANVLLGGVEGQVPYIDRRHQSLAFEKRTGAGGNATPGRRGK
jgi:hypothetical protein